MRDQLDPDVPDPIRAAASSDTGNAGEAVAIADFAKLGMPGTATTAAQDLGTDMLIIARDRRFDRGEFLGAQVKSGDTNLDKPITEDGRKVGWWVKVQAKHEAYWVANAIPHILVLYDHHSDRCYWERLTGQTIVSTGKGRRVKVPTTQIVCQAQADDLRAVAAAARPALALEGTAWTGAAPKAATDQLRYGLIAPRVIAPHPNSGRAPASSTEAVAMLMQSRVDEVWPPLTPHEGVPSREKIATHATWGWRFVGALADWLTAAQEPDFAALTDITQSSHERVATIAVRAHRDVAAGAPDSARALLTAEIAADKAAPVDHAWLHLHLARANQQLGNLGEAREAASVSVAIGATQHHDVTATAIRGAAAAVLFDVSPLDRQDLASTLEYNDTAVSWWRSRTAYRGLVSLIETVFDDAVGYGASDRDDEQANNQLLVASVQAGVLGSDGQWRHISGLLARQQLIHSKAASSSELAESLDLLRRSGAERASSRATAWLAANGPADAVREAARKIDLTRSTSGSIVADLAMLQSGGDVLDEDTATAAAAWLCAAMTQPDRLLALTHTRSFDHQQLIAERLEGVFRAIPDEGAARTVTVLEQYAADFWTLAARCWADVLTSIPAWAWAPEHAARLEAAPVNPDHLRLRAAVASVRQVFDASARDVPVSLVTAGALWALDYLDSLEALDESVLDDLREAHVARVTRDEAAAHTGKLTHEVGVAPLAGLVSVLLVHPVADAFRLVGRILADPVMPAWYKQQAIARLGTSRDDIDPAIRYALADALAGVDEHPPSTQAFFGDPPIVGEVAYATVRLSGDDERAPGEVARLAAGSNRERWWATRLAADTAQLGPLTILAADSAPNVRGAAARGLALAVVNGAGGEAVLSILARAIADRGWATGIAAAHVLDDHANVAALNEVRGLLTDHPSAAVRRLARGLRN